MLIRKVKSSKVQYSATDYRSIDSQRSVSGVGSTWGNHFLPAIRLPGSPSSSPFKYPAMPLLQCPIYKSA